MADEFTKEKVLWEGRKHWLWFPFSFTKYSLTEDRFYSQKGLLSTHYDELLLYRVTDICLTRTLGQKLCGTGTITLTCKGDAQRIVTLRSIKDSIRVKNNRCAGRPESCLLPVFRQPRPQLQTPACKSAREPVRAEGGDSAGEAARHCARPFPFFV